MRASRGMGAIAPAKKPRKTKNKLAIPSIAASGGISGLEGSGIKGMASGGAVSGSKRDGCVRKGHTRGKFI